MRSDESGLITYYAPAGRDEPQELQRKQQIVGSVPLLQQTIDAMPEMVLILNEHRQIISANRHLLELLTCQLDDVIGRRPGELVGCHNVGNGPDGCGTAHDCMTCGAIHAILESDRSQDRITRECRILLQEPVGGALDLNVCANVVEMEGERFTICVLRDISDQKRLAVLARLFFHDVMNTAGGIQGFTHLLSESLPEDTPEAREMTCLAELADQLVEEIQAQRDLTFAESGDLEPEFSEVHIRTLLQRLQALHARNPVARDRKIELGDSWVGVLKTDSRLLSRVLGNMLKNALEATARGGTVTIGSRLDDDRAIFRIHNSEVMPPNVQIQVFQRSFSTKASQGRGIGTHSMKLLGERYLGGKVGFTSREGQGTTFFISLPLEPSTSLPEGGERTDR